MFILLSSLSYILLIVKFSSFFWLWYCGIVTRVLVLVFFFVFCFLFFVCVLLCCRCSCASKSTAAHIVLWISIFWRNWLKPVCFSSLILFEAVIGEFACSTDCQNAVSKGKWYYEMTVANSHNSTNADTHKTVTTASTGSNHPPLSCAPSGENVPNQPKTTKQVTFQSFSVQATKDWGWTTSESALFWGQVRVKDVKSADSDRYGLIGETHFTEAIETIRASPQVFPMRIPRGALHSRTAPIAEGSPGFLSRWLHSAHPAAPNQLLLLKFEIC
jgi:hypothetical protein